MENREWKEKSRTVREKQGRRAARRTAENKKVSPGLNSYEAFSMKKKKRGEGNKILKSKDHLGPTVRAGHKK